MSNSILSNVKQKTSNSLADTGSTSGIPPPPSPNLQRINGFSEGVPIRGGGLPTYFVVQFSRKLHKNEENWNESVTANGPQFHAFLENLSKSYVGAPSLESCTLWKIL